MVAAWEEASTRLKNEQAELTKFRRLLLEGNHVPMALVRAHTMRLAHLSRLKILELAPRLARDIASLRPELFKTRAEAAALEEAIEKSVDGLLNDVAAQAWTLEAEPPTIGASQVRTEAVTYRGRGRPRKTDIKEAHA